MWLVAAQIYHEGERKEKINTYLLHHLAHAEALEEAETSCVPSPRK
jgi:hypothetical protein